MQTRAQIDYVALKEGQVVNHIPNNTVITSKLGLLETLRDYAAAAVTVPNAAAASGSVGAVGEAGFDWFPLTFRLDQPADGIALLEAHDRLIKEGQQQGLTTTSGVVWILKPSSGNCGRGLRLVNDVSELRRECFGDSTTDQQAAEATGTDRTGRPLPSLSPAIAQRYVPDDPGNLGE